MELRDEPYWHKNKDWYYYNKEKMRFFLTDKATKEAIESYNEYYKKSNLIENADGRFLKENTIETLNIVYLDKYNIKELEQDKILFIMDSSDETNFIDNDYNYYVYNKYKKEITLEDVYKYVPNYKMIIDDYKKSLYKGINLGMGHALFIKKDIFDEFMSILRSYTTYENEFEDFYNGWQYYLVSIMDYLENKK